MQPTSKDILRFDPIPRKYLRALNRPGARHGLAAPAVLTADQLRSRFPNGVPLTIWHDAVKKAEMYTFQGYAQRWATVYGALGPGFALRRTWSDERPLADIALTAHARLRALTGDVGPWTKIRDLALFCHGQTSSILYGSRQLRIAHLEELTRQIADALSPDVRIVLYACNTCRNPAGPAEAHDWLLTTLNDGGRASFAATLRDWLVRLGKPGCEVWGHTTRGHTAHNFALRCFRGRDGVGSAGVSFARGYVHDWQGEYLARSREAVAAAGFTVRPGDEARFKAAAEKFYARQFYKVYRLTCGNAENVIDQQRLAMSAPMKPEETAALIRRRWEEAWKDNRVSWGQQIARAAKLHA